NRPDVPNLTYGELVTHANLYNGKLVRVTGIYVWGFESADLLDAGGLFDPTWVQFGTATDGCDDVGLHAKFDAIRSKGDRATAKEDRRTHSTTVASWYSARV